MRATVVQDMLALTRKVAMHSGTSPLLFNTAPGSIGQLFALTAIMLVVLLMGAAMIFGAWTAVATWRNCLSSADIARRTRLVRRAGVVLSLAALMFAGGMAWVVAPKANQHKVNTVAASLVAEVRVGPQPSTGRQAPGYLQHASNYLLGYSSWPFSVQTVKVSASRAVFAVSIPGDTSVACVIYAARGYSWETTKGECPAS